MTKKTKRLLAAGVILGVIAVVLGIKHDLTRILWNNLTAKKVKLDDSAEWNGGKNYEGLQYSAVSESDYLDLYVPDSEEKVPLFVLIHGGGFLFGDSQTRQAQFMYRYFRDHGYACASVNYRLAQEEPFPGAVEDVKAAIRFLKANADQYGYDAERVAVWGESAGGYLCTMAGVTTDEDFHGIPFIGEEERKEPVSADVDVIVNFYGCEQFGTMEEQFEELGIPGLIRSVANMWLKQGLKENNAQEYSTMEGFWLRKELDECTKEELNQASPHYYIQKNLGENSEKRMLIWHGDADITVPWYQSRDLYQTMSETIGADKVSFQLYHNLGHAADTFYSDENLSKVKTYLDENL